jgi:hypothetical protein
MVELNIKAGDEIMYSCAAGRLRATVRSVRFGATARPGHSIAWLNITTHVTTTRTYPSNLSIPADADSLKMYQVEVVCG